MSILLKYWSLTVWKIASSFWVLNSNICQSQRLSVFLLFVCCVQLTVASQTSVQNVYSDFEHCFEFNNSSERTLGYNIHQQIQYEKLRLDFLKKCRPLKRPPQSLRISGANALDESDKLILISKLESELLEKAITKKILEIENMRNKLRESPGEFLHIAKSIPIGKRKLIVNNFQKKLNFFTGQNETKWKLWPNKTNSKNKKNSNYGKKCRKRRNFVQKLADRTIKNNIVIPLVDMDIPAGAIVLLSRGLGFVKTPSLDKIQIQLDMRSAANNIRSTADKLQSGPSSGFVPSNSIPPKLKNRNYHKGKPSSDPVVNTLVDEMESDITGILRFKGNHATKKKSNISRAEQEGYKWLKKHVDDKKIVICQADKGGAILIVEPTLIEQKVEEKLFDESLYNKIETDPSLKLFDELFDVWKQGRDAGFVSHDEAYEILGVTKPDVNTGCVGGRKSTAARYRPGIPYFYPMLKIHKLSPEQLKPGCNPPARLVTALNVGVCKRSDSFLAHNYLKNAEKLFCQDLVKDTTGALQWLEILNDRYTTAQKKLFKCFTFDFASLYDSLSPALVLEATGYALEKVYTDWSKDKIDWVMSLIELSLRSSVGCYKGKWYQQKKGIATGGTICVELANITVCYVMEKILYSDPEMMKNVTSFKRFVDDCVGAFKGPVRLFRIWEKSIRDKLLEFGLKTDDFVVCKSGEPLPFLDIQFYFDCDGQLKTDLYRKPTDSPSFLNFSSHHPNHIFSSIVYSQAIRYRRIINSNEKFHQRLSELSETFHECGYPEGMVKNILNKVRGFSRNIIPKDKTPKVSDPIPIRIVSTYGANDFLEQTLEKYEILLRQTSSFCSLNANTKMFDHVYRTAPKLGGLLSSTKQLVIGNGPGPTIPCGSGRCQSCPLMTNKDTVSFKDKSLRPKSGSCLARNIIYFASCLLCLKGYVGKTICQLRTRINGHRALYYKIKKDPIRTISENTYNNDLSLAYHLYKEHNCTDPADFNKVYRFTILQHCNPDDLDVAENRWIHELRTLEPGGINASNPFSIPLIQ